MLGWSDIDIKANREFLRKDKELEWELNQILNGGPNWRDQIVPQGAEPTPPGGATPGAQAIPPSFGGAAEAGAEAIPPAGGNTVQEPPPAAGGAPAVAPAT